MANTQNPKNFTGHVSHVLIADQPQSFITRPVPQIELAFGGIPGDRHFGLTKPAGSREPWYPRGTTIANRRQISLISQNELQLIAEALGIPECLPAWVGANIVLHNVENCTTLPAGTRIIWPSGAGIAIEGKNRPCRHPGAVIAKAVNRPELASQFVQASYGRRGLIGIVENPGLAQAGQEVTIALPKD